MMTEGGVCFLTSPDRGGRRKEIFLGVDMRLALALGAVLLVGCGTTTSETYSRDQMPDVGTYPVAPAGVKKVRVAAVDFEDKTGERVGDQAAEQMTSLLLRCPDRFNVIERSQLKNLLREQGLEGVVDPSELARPGKVRGVDYLVYGSVTNLRVKMVRQQTGFDVAKIAPRIPGALEIDTSKTVVHVQCDVDVKMVNTTTGEIVAGDFGAVNREDVASAWGMKILSIGGSAKNELHLDKDSYGRILRRALDDAFRKMLPRIDDKLSRPQAALCPKCKVEMEPGKKFCTKCGTSVEPQKCKCGAEIEAGAKFCGNCGAKVEK